MREEKSILVLKDDYHSYLSLIGCVMLNIPVDMILQLESEKDHNFLMISELNNWLHEKKYPSIVNGCQTLTVIENVECSRGVRFITFPSDLHRELSCSRGLIVKCKNGNYSLTSCIDTWGWEFEFDDIKDMVMRLSDVPAFIKDELEEMYKTSASYHDGIWSDPEDQRDSFSSSLDFDDDDESILEEESYEECLDDGFDENEFDEAS